MVGPDPVRRGSPPAARHGGQQPVELRAQPIARAPAGRSGGGPTRRAAARRRPRPWRGRRAGARGRRARGSGIDLLDPLADAADAVRPPLPDAKNGTSAPIAASVPESSPPASSGSSRQARPRRQAAAASDEPPPRPAATGIRFSSARQACSGGPPSPARRPRHARFSSPSGSASTPSPSSRRPLPPDMRRSRSASSSRTRSLVEQVIAVRPPADDREGQVELGRRVEAKRSAHGSGASSPVRQAHSSTRQRLRPPLRIHAAGSESAASTTSRSTGSSRVSPLWTCLRRCRNPACTTR